EAGGARAEPVLRSPRIQRDVAYDQHDAKRRRKLQEFRRAVEALEQQTLDGSADERDGKRRKHDGAPEACEATAERTDQGPGDVGAQHVERAVREIDDARDSKNQRQPRGDKEERRRAGEAVQELREERGERHAGGRRVRFARILPTLAPSLPCGRGEGFSPPAATV